MRVWLIVLVALLAFILFLYVTGVVVCACVRRRKRQHLVGILQKTVPAAKACGQKFTASYGTALGAVREKRIIPHDDDLDFDVFGREESKELCACLGKTFEGSKHHRVVQTGGGMTQCRVTGRGALGKQIHADIYWTEQDKESGVYLRALEQPLWRAGRRSETQPYAKDQALTTIMIHGVEVPVPKDADKHLRFMYGDDYMTPIPYKKTGLDGEDGRLRLRAALHKVGLYV